MSVGNAMRPSAAEVGNAPVNERQPWLDRMVARPDCSVVEVECAPADYSASHLARAVEDADVHLTDLLTSPAEGGKVLVTMRVSCADPISVVHHLERYGYAVRGWHAASGNFEPVVAVERLLGLQALINV